MDKTSKTIDQMIASIEGIEKGHKALDVQVASLANILLSAGFERREDKDGGRATYYNPSTGQAIALGLWGEDRGLVEINPVGTPLSVAIVVALSEILEAKRMALQMRNRQIRDLRRALRK